jgi:hypothetical protein
MAQCVAVTQNQDGTLVFRPVTQPDLQQCQFVLQTGAEVGNSLSIFTPDDALQLMPYVALVMAIAWSFKQIAKTLNEVGNEKHDD